MADCGCHGIVDRDGDGGDGSVGGDVCGGVGNGNCGASDGGGSSEYKKKMVMLVEVMVTRTVMVRRHKVAVCAAKMSLHDSPMRALHKLHNHGGDVQVNNHQISDQWMEGE